MTPAARDRGPGPETEPPGSGRTAVVFLTHMWHEHVRSRYRRLADAMPPDHELVVAFDVTDADPDDVAAARRTVDGGLYRFRFRDLSTSGYPRPWAGDNDSRLVPGNVDLLLLHLHRTGRRYDRYWVVEYDVEFTGAWRDFFEAFRTNGSDLLGTTLHPYRVLPEFHWWDAVEAPGSLVREDLHRGFFPVMRITEEGLRALDGAYSDGWSGHCEVVLPTALLRDGARIEDIGGEGPFVRPGNENRFYTNTPWRTGLGPGTFIYRPARRWPGLTPGKLWHPVKPTEGRLSQYLALAKDWLEARAGGPRERGSCSRAPGRGAP